MLPPPPLPPPPPVPLDVSDADTERRLNSMCTENPDRFFNNLLDIICSSAADSQRRLQAVLALRHFLRLNSDLKSRLRDDAKVEEETRYLLEELRGAAIELGSYLLPDDSWPEFYSWMAAISPRVRESALFIFSRLAHLIQWQSILPRLDLLRSSIRCSLNIKLSGVDVPYERNAALLAAITLIHIVPPSEDCQKLQDLLPDMISVLLQAFTGNQQDFAKEAVIRLTHLIAVKAQFISPCLRKVLEAMLHIAEFHKVNRELRREAVNLVVTLAKKEPGTANLMFIIFSCCIHYSLGVAYHRLIYLTNIMMREMNWDGLEGFLEAERKVWKVDGELFGYVQRFRNLSHVVISGAGHLVPADKGSSAQAMIEDWVMQKGLFGSS